MALMAATILAEPVVVQKHEVMLLLQISLRGNALIILLISFVKKRNGGVGRLASNSNISILLLSEVIAYKSWLIIYFIKKETKNALFIVLQINFLHFYQENVSSLVDLGN